MRHLLPTALFGVLSLAAPTASAADHKWTSGSTVCEAGGRAVLDSPILTTVESQPLEQAWDYALQDVEALGNLSCFPEAAGAAHDVAIQLHSLEEQILPGVKATACDQASRASDSRLAAVKDSLAGMRGSEIFFQTAFERYDGILHEITGRIPVGGVAFDDCRAKAQRGWARARASLNSLSCAVSASMDRLDSFRERAQQSGLAALECAAPAVAQAPPAAGGTAALVVAPAQPLNGN